MAAAVSLLTGKGVEVVNLDSLLGAVTKTFSLGIRLLPQPLRKEITIAYLLFRVADTLEDSEVWTAEKRIQALSDFGRLLRETASPWPCGGPTGWAHDRPTEDPACLRLLDALPDLLGALRETAPEARAAIIRHVERTIDGMIWFQTRGGRPHELRMRDLADLRHYSYVVAGVVGELLTELFVLRGALPHEWRGAMAGRSLAFGEGLQLVNILKDAPDDAKAGRDFLAPGADAPTLVKLARYDLEAAEGYITALRLNRAPRGVIAFLWFTLRLAQASLDRVERDGVGVKISKDEVVAHYAAAVTHQETLPETARR